jgi:hypothetical protein
MVKFAWIIRNHKEVKRDGTGSPPFPQQTARFALVTLLADREADSL